MLVLVESTELADSFAAVVADSFVGVADVELVVAAHSRMTYGEASQLETRTHFGFLLATATEFYKRKNSFIQFVNSFVTRLSHLFDRA